MPALPSPLLLLLLLSRYQFNGRACLLAGLSDTQSGQLKSLSVHKIGSSPVLVAPSQLLNSYGF